MSFLFFFSFPSEDCGSFTYKIKEIIQFEDLDSCIKVVLVAAENVGRLVRLQFSREGAC